MRNVPGTNKGSRPTFHSVRVIRHDGELHAIQPRSHRSDRAALKSARALANGGLGAMVLKLFDDADGLAHMCVVASFGARIGAVPAVH
jgi:hypothetical protein